MSVHAEVINKEQPSVKTPSVRPPPPPVEVITYEMATSVPSGPMAKLSDIEFGDLDPRTQPRTLDKSFLESIKTYGILQPVVVGLKADGKYLLIGGRGRVRAAQELGMKEVPIFVKPIPKDIEGLSPTTIMEFMAMSENLDRQNMNAWDIFIRFSKFVEAGITQTQIAKQVSRSDGYVSQHLQIGKLDPRVQNIIKHNAPDTAILSKARTLAKLNHEPEIQYTIAKECFNKEDPWTFTQLSTAVDDTLLRIKHEQKKAAEKAALKEKVKEAKKKGESEESVVAAEDVLDEEDDPYKSVEIVTPGKKIFRTLLTYLNGRLNHAKLMPDETEEQKVKKLEKVAYEKGRLEGALMTAGQKDVPKTVLKAAGVEAE